MFELFHDFEVLSKYLDFEAAAKDLAVSQPTLSRHILSLEQELHVRLFDRRPLRLTQAGIYLLENMIPLINEAELVAKRAASLNAETSKTPLIASMIDLDSSFTQTIMSAAVKMKSIYDNFIFRIETDGSQSLADMVYSKVSDLAFLLTKPTSVRPGFQCTFVMNETINLWVHKDNPILHIKQPTLSELTQSALIVSKNQALNSWSQALVELFRKANIPIQTHQKILNVLVEYMFDIQPDEVIAFPSKMGGIPPNVTNPDLRKVPIDPHDLTYDVWALYPEEATNPFVEPFLKICKQINSSKA